MPAIVARFWRVLVLLVAALVSSAAWAATPAGTVITNTVQASWQSGAVPQTVSASRTITVSAYTAGPDMKLVMAGPAQALPGSTMIWKLLVTNLGPTPGSGAQVAITVPPGVTAISAVCAVLNSATCGVVNVGAPTAAGTPVIITLPSVSVGGSVEITLRGTAPAAGTLNTSAMVSIPGLIDPIPTNNLAVVPTVISAAAATTGALNGRVWLDANHDRRYTTGESLYAGFVVRIYDATGATLVRQVVTDANGAYSMAGLPAGISYQLEFRNRAGNLVYGLPVTADTGGSGFADATSCNNLAETQPPNVVSQLASGTCYSLTYGGSTAQVQRTGRTLLLLQAGDNVIEQSLPLDPSGVVYDTVTRLPVAGASVTFNGPPGFDPALHLLGGLANQTQVTDASGFYQYLLVGGAPSGVYTLTLVPPAGYASPSTQILPAPVLDPTGLGVGGFYLVQAQDIPPSGAQPTTYHLAFNLAMGDPNVINNHIPLDPLGGAGTLTLVKSASKPIVAIGDFLQYQLTLGNPGVTNVAGVSITDRLPPGFRYRKGSTRIANAPAADPLIAADGRTLTFAIGVVAAGASINIRYVAEVAAGTTLGDAVNTAQAAGAGGVRSLMARATVSVREDLFGSRAILLGRVIEVGDAPVKVAAAGKVVTGEAEARCGPEKLHGKGIEGARIFLEDGTYVRTDKEGKWHVDGVKPGTHVVQLDVKSLPDGYEAVLCDDNTRRGGRAYSQFVNVQGGTLWRADFYVRKTGGTEYEAGHRLSVARTDGDARVNLEVKGITAAVRNISSTIALPPGAAFRAGSAQVNGQRVDDPQVSDNLLVFRLGDANGDWARSLAFEITGTPAADAPVLATSQFQSADGELRRLGAVRVALRADAAPVVSSPEIIQYKQILTKVPAVQPLVPGQPAQATAARDDGRLNIYAPGAEKFDVNWLAAATPGLEMVYPPENFIPGINATKVLVKHDMAHKITVLINGVPVHALNFDGSDTHAAKNLAISRWGGAMLKGGANKIVAVAADDNGREIARVERVIHFAGSAVEGKFVAEASTLIADGRSAPVIAVRIFDRDGKPARPGTDGAMKINAPYQSLEVQQRRDAKPLLDDQGNEARWRVGADGIALIRLQPTTTAGEVVITFNFPDRPPQMIRAWLQPELRDWILVGFGEGTIGHRKLSGALENLPGAEADDHLHKDGRVAFYAKGRIDGDFLATIAYDTDKERKRAGGNSGSRFDQSIDRKQYYTIYGDVTSAQHDAASVRKLYLKIEKSRFYAMFGDFSTGMSMTELARYSRTLNGVKSEFRGENVSYTAFATRTAQAFVKDELRPDGTSGLYRLTRRNLLPNSEKVAVETRDRFRNEIVIKSEPLSRGLDYEIDYTLGTLIFRKAIPGKDQNLNPIYLVVDYESEDDARDERTTAGGRLALRFADNKAEIGVSGIHEGTRGANADLAGVDVSYQISDKTRLRAEHAGSRREIAGAGNVKGDAYLAEVRHQDANIAATAYVRGQDTSFGLGQQAAAQGGTVKYGGDASYKISEALRANVLAYHERADSAGATADRSVIEGRMNHTTSDYALYGGARAISEHTALGVANESNQIVSGGSYKLLDGRVNLRVDSEVSAGGNNASADFPHRLSAGVDLKISDTLSAFVTQELAYGANENASTTRIGVRSRPWEGGESASTINVGQTPGGPLLSTSSTMTQSLRMSETLTFNAGLDRTSTLRKPGNRPLHANTPSAQGVNAGAGASSQSLAPISTGFMPTPVEDYTALFAGVTWRDGPWGATLRGEYRNGVSFDKINLAASVHRDLNAGEALAITMLYTGTTGDPAGDTDSLDLRLSYAYRPIDSRLIVLNRLDYIQEESQRTGGQHSRRLVNNFNANYQAERRLQVAMQYGAKYAFDSFDRFSAHGYTDLMGGEARYDLGKRFDIGARAAMLHSWGAKTYTPSYGLSVGYSPVTNLWVGMGHNFAGFRDEDFSGANTTQKGWYLFFRFKVDQGVKDPEARRKVIFEEMAR